MWNLATSQWGSVAISQTYTNRLKLAALNTAPPTFSTSFWLSPRTDVTKFFRIQRCQCKIKKLAGNTGNGANCGVVIKMGLRISCYNFLSFFYYMTTMKLNKDKRFQKSRHQIADNTAKLGPNIFHLSLATENPHVKKLD